MSERKQLSGKDWASIVLFGAGSLGLVLMFLAIRALKPLPDYGPLGSLAELWKNVFGIYPSVFFNGALMYMGFRMFVMEARENVGRNLIASLGLTAALSVLVGAFSREAGGTIGERTSWFVANQLHLTAGVLLGMIAVFAAIWFGWIRATNTGVASDEAPVEAPTAAMSAAKTAAKAIQRPAVHKTTAANEGVSPAESAALFPEEDELPVVRKLEPTEVVKAAIPPSPYPEDVRRKGQIPPGAKPLVNPNASAFVPEAPEAPVAPTIYRFTGTRPELVEEPGSPSSASRADVGATIPLARPIADANDDLAAVDLPAPSWEQPALFRPEEGDEEPVDAYGTPMTLVEKLRRARRDAGLEGGAATTYDVEAEDRDEVVVASDVQVVSAASIVEDVPFTAAATDGDDDEDDEDDLLDLDDDEATDEDSDDEESYAEEIDEDADTILGETDDEHDEEEEAPIESKPVVVRATSVPREIDDLGDDGDEADAPMARAAVTPSVASVVVPVVVADLDDAVPTSKGSPVVPSFEADVDDETTPYETTEDDEVESEPEVVVVAARARVDADEETDEDLDADDAQDFEDESVDEEVAAEADLDEETVEEEDSDADAEETVVVAVAEVEEFDSDDDEMAEETAVSATAADVSAPVISAPVISQAAASPSAASTSRGAAPVRADALQPSLFDAVESAAPAAAAQDAASADRANRDVVLQPRAASASDRTPKAPKTEAAAEADPRLQQLSEIGCLFIERGRVAVSMLQRQYEMDFDDACKVLDDLQEMGLIGPYLGGQRRDILLTREQWLERVSQAGAMR